MHDYKPFGFDSIEQSLGPVVAHLGGIKAVACRLWPTLDADRAQRRLADQLNPDRPEKLDLADYAAILLLARKAGCDTGAAYLLRLVGYADPQPIDPEEEARRVQSSLLTEVRHLENELAHLRELHAEEEAPGESAPGRQKAAARKRRG